MIVSKILNVYNENIFIRIMYYAQIYIDNIELIENNSI